MAAVGVGAADGSAILAGVGTLFGAGSGVSRGAAVLAGYGTLTAVGSYFVITYILMQEVELRMIAGQRVQVRRDCNEDVKMRFVTRAKKVQL